MDFGKFKYESALKARESRKNQAQTVIKEIKIRPKIDPHDYGTKKGHVERFLRQGDKVKVTIMFRGREQSRPELGYKLLQRLAGDVEELGFVESQPKQDGRNMIMVIGPLRKKAETKAVRGQDRASARAAAPAHATGRDSVGTAAPRPPAPAASAAPRPGTTSAAARPGTVPSAGTAARPGPAPSAGSGARPGPARSGGSGRPGPAPSAGTARPGPAPSAGTARPGPGSSGGAAARPGPGPSARPAAARPAAPAGAAPKPGQGTPRPQAPKPGPSAGGTPRPAAPRPGPPPGGRAKPSPPKPSAPRSSSAKPGEAGKVPTARPAEHGAEAGS